MNLIDFDNLSLKQYDNEPIVYDMGNGSHCNISTGESKCSGEITRSLNVTEGKDGKALQLIYGLGECSDSYVQVVFTFDPPQDLSAYDHLVIDWRGNQTANSLEVGITDAKIQQIAPSYGHVTQKSWWGPLVVPFRHIGSNLDLTKVKTIFISVKNNSKLTKYKDEGGIGNITIDNLGVLNISARTIPSVFEITESNSRASTLAAEWLASQQRPTGLLKSWEKENEPNAYTYDQALALIVFSQEKMWDHADKLVDVMVRLQNNGSWYDNYDCNNMTNKSANKWIGAVAWMVYALDRYQSLGGTHSEAKVARENASKWLEDQMDSSHGCIEDVAVEGIMDTWQALQATGHDDNASELKNCIMSFYWDDEMGCFKEDKNKWMVYLDIQTLGALMLKASGDNDEAHRALSYAREVLYISSQGEHLSGLSASAGPWGIWNEGTGQYIVAGGEGSNQFLEGLISQQMDNGTMPGSPDNFAGEVPWDTKMYGVAPTAWLYFASNKGPFNF